MLSYFIMFLIVGAILGFIFKDEKSGMGVIIIISIVWAFIFGAWAILTFFELLLGFVLIKKLSSNT